MGCSLIGSSPTRRDSTTDYLPGSHGPHSGSVVFAAVDFFNQINMLYGTITEFCTEASCPVMSAGPR